MLGSGCKNCPVTNCQTLRYRGSTCATQRDKFGLGDPFTWEDKIKSETPEYLARQLYRFFVAGMQLMAEATDTQLPPVDEEKGIGVVLAQLEMPYTESDQDVPIANKNSGLHSE